MLGVFILKTAETSYPVMDLHEIHDFELDSFYRTPLSSMLHFFEKLYVHFFEKLR